MPFSPIFFEFLHIIALQEKKRVSPFIVAYVLEKLFWHLLIDWGFLLLFIFLLALVFLMLTFMIIPLLFSRFFSLFAFLLTVYGFTLVVLGAEGSGGCTCLFRFTGVHRDQLRFVLYLYIPPL